MALLEGGVGGPRDPSRALLFWTPNPQPNQLGPPFLELASLLCPLAQTLVPAEAGGCLGVGVST